MQFVYYLLIHAMEPKFIQLCRYIPYSKCTAWKAEVQLAHKTHAHKPHTSQVDYITHTRGLKRNYFDVNPKKCWMVPDEIMWGGCRHLIVLGRNLGVLGRNFKGSRSSRTKFGGSSDEILGVPGRNSEASRTKF